MNNTQIISPNKFRQEKSLWQSNLFSVAQKHICYIVALMLLMLANTAQAQISASSTCGGATGVCSGSSYTFAAGVNSGTAETGASYGCLTTQPNPAWFFLQVKDSGSITLSMSSNQGRDIDFAMWGPFTSPTAPCVSGLTAAKRVACSYSTASTESGTIPNGKNGEYYVILITNYSNRATDITFSQTGGTGTSNCDILCNITGLTATAGSCGTGANLGKYSITGTVTTFTPPTTGSITISSSCGGSVTYNAPFSSPLSYTISGISGNSSGPCTVTASYSAVTTCTKSVTMTPSVCCTVTPGSGSTVCQGGSFTLSATGTTGGTYTWSGPGGYGSNLQSRSISPAQPTYAGTYNVYLTLGACTTSVAPVVIVVKPLPTAAVTVSGSTTFCSGDSVTLTAPSGTGFTYQWLLNGSNISGATSSTYAAKASGSYTVTVTQSGCTPSSATSTATTVTVNAVPTATITAGSTTTFCQGGSVVLSANTGTGLTYQWQLNGTNISGATSSTCTATATGSYTVVVKNSSNCTKTSSATTVTVNPLPTASLTNGSLATYCSGGSVKLQAVTGSGVSYAWKKNGSSISGTNSSKTVSSDGDYTVTVTITSTGCVATSPITTVLQSTTATASVTPETSTTFCQGDSVVLDANVGVGYTYQWRLNGSNISGATDTEYVAKTSGTYSVVVTQSGCTPPSATSSGVTITVNSLPTSTITASGVTTFCQGDSVTLNANTGTGLTYQWQLNGTNISGKTASSLVVKASGDYTVVVTKNSCPVISAITTVTVNALTIATVSTTPSGSSTSVCDHDSVILSANSGTGYTYQWKLNGSSISGATSQTYAAMNGGDYAVIIQDGNGCFSALSSAMTITIKPLPSAIITPQGPTTFCQPNTVVLDADKGTAFAYQWKLAGSDISGATNPTYTVSSTGNYTVVLSKDGCSSTSSITAVTVNPKPTTSLIYHR